MVCLAKLWNDLFFLTWIMATGVSTCFDFLNFFLAKTARRVYVFTLLDRVFYPTPSAQLMQQEMRDNAQEQEESSFISGWSKFWGSPEEQPEEEEDQSIDKQRCEQHFKFCVA